MYFLIIFKFKINGREFVVEQKIPEDYNQKHFQEVSNLERYLMDRAKAVFLHFTLKSFVGEAYKQITGEEWLSEESMKAIINW